MTETIFQGTTISHKSPVAIDHVTTNFGALYNITHGTAGVGNGTMTFVDGAGLFTSGMAGSTIVIPSLNLRLSISSYTNSTTVVLSGNVSTATGLVWYLDTTLNDLSLGAVSAAVKFANATAWKDETGTLHTYAAGDYAVTASSLASLGSILTSPAVGLPIRGIWCTIFTDQSTPCATIGEGLPGNVVTGIDYEMEVMFNQIVGSTVESRIVGIYNFTVFQPPV